MPSRLVSLSIVVAWLAMTGCLLYREVWPLFRSGEPPRYSIDLTEEVGANAVNWIVFKNDRRIGSAQSQVVRVQDREFELRGQLNFEGMTFANHIDLQKVTLACRVDEAGHVRGLGSQLSFRAGPHEWPSVAEIEGRVRNGVLEPKLKWLGVPVDIGQVEIPMQGSILNPMLPINRVPGLRAGQHWRIPLFDPLALQGKGWLTSLLPQLPHVPEVEAEVTDAVLHWDDEDVPCFKIEYRAPGQNELQARTWVRRRDGLVLQQDAHNEFLDLVIQRAPVR